MIKLHVLREMVEKFQCPGCVAGSDTQCGSYEIADTGTGGFNCSSHVVGTSIVGIGQILLGMPKGFNRVGLRLDALNPHKFYIRLHPQDAQIMWNKFNIPMWAMEHEGHLFVRTYSPRINLAYIDVFQGWTLADIQAHCEPGFTPSVVNVGEFIDEID